MDILENIVYPQSASHIMLLKYLFFLALLILLPYMSVLLGTTLFSSMHFSKGRRLNDRNHLIFAHDLIDLFTINKGMSFTLGLVPILSLMFILSQIFYESTLNLTPNLVYIFVLFIVAIIYIYTYKYSFKLKNIFNLVNSEEIKDERLVNEFKSFRSGNSKLLSKSGIIGFFLLTFTAYLLIGVLEVTYDPSRWDSGSSFFSVLFSLDTILYFLFYMALSLSITCAAILYKFLKNEHGNYQTSYLEYVKNFALKTGMIFTTVQPLLFVVTIINTDKSALSFTMFLVFGLGLLLMMLINVILYQMYKTSKTELSSSLVFVFLILFSVLLYKDKLALDVTTKVHSDELTLIHDQHVAQIKTDAGIEEIVEIDGKDIYNAKCIACHRFDTKLVGPAYKDVLPKYEGKREELVDFILNPRKINPDFPSMPNQGLKPKEAEAIADYIVKTYESQK